MIQYNKGEKYGIFVIYYIMFYNVYDFRNRSLFIIYHNMYINWNMGFNKKLTSICQKGIKMEWFKDSFLMLIFVVIFIIILGLIFNSLEEGFVYENITANIDYKFQKKNDSYIVYSTIKDGKKNVDIARIDAQDYDNLEIGQSYNLYIKSSNNWNQIKKKIDKIKEETKND